MSPKQGKTHNINHVAPYYTHFNFNLSKQSAIYTENQGKLRKIESLQIYLGNGKLC